MEKQWTGIGKGQFVCHCIICIHTYVVYNIYSIHVYFYSIFVCLLLRAIRVLLYPPANHPHPLGVFLRSVAKAPAESETSRKQGTAT